MSRIQNRVAIALRPRAKNRAAPCLAPFEHAKLLGGYSGWEMTKEEERLQASVEREVHWKRWGPYLSERQWGTVREDYSPNGDAWNYFPHDHARSRAYRWGEDGIGGICDRHQHICFAFAFWNEKDPILKERLFGLTNLEGNHGEDVKEYYYYLDATPTSSYLNFSTNIRTPRFRTSSSLPKTGAARARTPNTN